jgi:3-hydroxyisobutyrate dehydrogenase
VLQMHMGAAMLRPDAQACLAGDFAAMMETMALTAGMKLTSEDKKVPTGLEN